MNQQVINSFETSEVTEKSTFWRRQLTFRASNCVYPYEFITLSFSRVRVLEFIQKHGFEVWNDVGSWYTCLWRHWDSIASHGRALTLSPMISEADFFQHQFPLMILKTLQKVSCCAEFYKSWIEIRQAAKVRCDRPRRLHEFEAVTHWEDRKRKRLVARSERNSNKRSFGCHRTRAREASLSGKLCERGSEVVRVSYQLLIDDFHSSVVVHPDRVSSFNPGIIIDTRLHFHHFHQQEYWSSLSPKSSRTARCVSKVCLDHGQGREKIIS